MNTAQFICGIKDWPMQLCVFDGDGNGYFEPSNPRDYATVGFGFQPIAGDDLKKYALSQFNVSASATGSYQMATLVLFSRHDANPLFRMTPALQAALQTAIIQPQPLPAPINVANLLGQTEEIDQARPIQLGVNNPGNQTTFGLFSMMGFPTIWSARNLGEEAIYKKVRLEAMSAVLNGVTHSDQARADAAKALGEMGGVEQLPQLYGALNNPNFSEMVAYAALLASRNLGNDSIYPALLAAYNTSTITPQMRKHIVEMAGMSFDPVALQIMSAAMVNDPDPYVRGQAVNYIMSTGDCSDLVSLKKVAEHDPRENIRESAEFAIDFISHEKECP